MVNSNRILTVLVALLLSATAANAVVADSLLRQVQHEQYGYINNIRHGSVNPTSLAATPLGLLAVIKTGYNLQNGDFHSPDVGRRNEDFFVEAYGLRRTKNVVFEGVFTYSNIAEDSKQWNSTLYQSPLNPFILADSLPSDYNKEKFHLAGRLSWDITDRLRAGINADYHVGVQSDEKDPRLEAKGMRFILNPGIEYDLGPVSVGLTGGINLINETEQYSSLQTAVVYRFFLMGGLGTFYPQSGASYNRDVKGTSWFAMPSAKLRINDRISDYLSIRYDALNENATDGGSTYRFLGGDWKDKRISVHNRFQILNGRNSHNIEINARYDDSKGLWYDQKAVTENGTTKYEIVNSSIKHKQTAASANVSYRFDRLDNARTPSLTAILSAGVENMDAKNYPEKYSRKTTHATAGASIMKRFFAGNVILRLKGDFAYRAKLSSSINASGLELYTAYTYPMYVWESASSLDAIGRINADIPVGNVIIGAEIYGGALVCTDGATSAYKDKSLGKFGGCIRLFF